MFRELAPLLPAPGKSGAIVMKLVRMDDKHLRLTLHPYGDDDNAPNIKPVAFEGTPEEFDTQAMDFTPLIEPEDTTSISDQVKKGAELNKKEPPKPKPAVVPKTAAKAPAAPAKPAAPKAPAKTAAEIAEEKAKKAADAQKIKDDAAAEKKRIEAEKANKAIEAKKEANRKKIAALQEEMAALETPAQQELPATGGA